MKYIIYRYGESEKGINLNGAIVCREENEKELDSFGINGVTAKGWTSKKPIFADFDYTEEVEFSEVSADGEVKNYMQIVISEEVYNMLHEKYFGKSGKFYCSAESWAQSRNAGAWNYIAKNFMHDPYDRG